MRPRILLILAVLAPLLVGFGGGRDRRGTEVWHRDLIPSTGFNDLCGEPIHKGAPNFTFSAVYNPDGPDPILLTPEFCEQNPDALMGTWANPDFYAANRWPEPDDRVINVPYHRVPMPVDWDGRRAFIEDHSATALQPLPPTRALPNPPWTLGDFIGVEGRMQLRCRADGSAHVRIRGRGYQPNVVLTVWLVWGNHPDTGLPPVVPQPLGGIPNTVTADVNGAFRFERQLAICPMRDEFGLSRPLAIDIASHPDGVSYGGYPENPLATFKVTDPETGEVFLTQGLGAGVVGMDQGVFALLIDQPPPGQ
ncbi:MAG: hypothetical protein ACR2QK_05200 [Acidimicrobiales bacterium]